MTNSTEEKPKLFLKPAILAFSILLSTFFGSLMFAKNLDEVGKRKEILKIILFSIFWNGILMSLLGKIINNTLIVYGITNVLGGLMLIVPFWNYYLREISDYNRRKAWGPLVVFVVVVGGFTAFVLLYKLKIN